MYKLKYKWKVHLRLCTKIFILIVFCLLAIILILYWVSFLPSDKFKIMGFAGNTPYKYLESEKMDVITERIVHIDLKGAPPKLSYFKKLLPLLSKLGATGLLIEYEDMFPYKGPLLKNISASNAYSMRDVQTLLSYAYESRLSVIPLIQTFGHMEFILKLKEFGYLREVPEYPQVICPTNKVTLTIIFEMVKQILEAHPNSTKLHIGSDEVWSVGICDRCGSIMNKFKWTKSRLFLEHVSAVSRGILKRYPHIRILMWDDEFRTISLNELRDSNVSSLVEPVIWKYTKNVDLGPGLWEIYAQTFPRLWIASAFKGATGSSRYLPDVKHHLNNHKSWLTTLYEYKSKINFQGVFITGWQRYDHFAILCELLPVAIPSLAMCLRLLIGRDDSPLEISKLLQCENPYGLVHSSTSPKCSYPGGDLYEIVLRFHRLKIEYSRVVKDSRVKGWMNDHNVKRGFTNTQYVDSATVILLGMKSELNIMESDLNITMQEVYDNYTIDEWNDTFLKPLMDGITKLCDSRERLLAKSYWPKRPF